MQFVLIALGILASYLKDLRTNRPPRPNGSRPLPSKGTGSTSEHKERLPPRASSALSMSRPGESKEDLVGELHPRSASALSHHRTTSELSYGSSAGRPLVQQPDGYYISRTISPNAKVNARHSLGSVAASGVYRESGQRWMERQEARSLRDALEEMDLQEERRIHAAAQEEATRLVWEHRNPGVPYKNPYAPYRNPDLDSNRFRQHSEKDSHARNKSLGGHGDSSREHRPSSDSSGDPSSPESQDGTNTKTGTSKKKGKVNFALPPEDSPTKGRSSATSRFRTANGDSSKGVFRNPEDSIYEEPEEESNSQTEQKNSSTASTTSALKVKPRNSLPQGSRPLPDRTSTVPYDKRYSQVEIHKNPPSQSRNPQYTTNPPPPSPDSKGEDAVPTKNGLEIRSDEIRAATSMKRKDRSPNLPMPTAVSDRPGQPIVSFDPNWKPKEEQSKNDKPKPPVPTINLPGESNDQTPSISVSPPKASVDKPADKPAERTRPLPDPEKNRQPKTADPKKMPPASEKNWYSPFTRTGVPTATCNACSQPISGKVVTAAGLRFHSECFTCYHCKTQLECVAFYQEPEAKRAERLANASEDDEDAKKMRFYCHLDFHELFSPRCKSCKTPIEGEVVVACGAEWHVGHFFCAECGDVCLPFLTNLTIDSKCLYILMQIQPFTQETPFVEKDGFAWCLRCHSRRTAARCMGCKQPVLDEVVVTALGGQWHDKCFVCHECGNPFGPEGRFFVKEGEPKRSAKGRIIGGPVQLAVCEKCEAIRLKASP